MSIDFKICLVNATAVKDKMLYIKKTYSHLCKTQLFLLFGWNLKSIMLNSTLEQQYKFMSRIHSVSIFNREYRVNERSIDLLCCFLPFIRWSFSALGTYIISLRWAGWRTGPLNHYPIPPTFVTRIWVRNRTRWHARRTSGNGSQGPQWAGCQECPLFGRSAYPLSGFGKPGRTSSFGWTDRSIFWRDHGWRGRCWHWPRRSRALGFNLEGLDHHTWRGSWTPIDGNNFGGGVLPVGVHGGYRGVTKTVVTSIEVVGTRLSGQICRLVTSIVRKIGCWKNCKMS